MRLAIVIAAYNEATRLGGVIDGIPRKLPGISKIEIIVINDGSRDATYEVAFKSGAIVLTHHINRGQGAALQTGFDYAKRHGYDIVVTFDADGQHQAHEIIDIIRPIMNGEADIALGSRFLSRKSENLSLLRMLTLKGGVIFTRIISRIDVTDTHNGFRALGPRALDAIYLRQDKMEHASELLDQITQHGLRYQEVPVTIYYSDYSVAKGQRSSQALRIAAKILVSKLFL